jgi:RNA polymerase sigma-70 factor (ECF subfamily)
VVERIRNGDPDGEETLYTALNAGARFFLRRRTGSDDVDDLVHDLFVTVVAAIRKGQLREPERLMGFVRTILFRVASHSVRRIRQSPSAVSDPQALAIQESRPDPEQSLMQRQKIELMHQVLAELRPRDRDVISRFYVHGQGELEIRQDMNLTATQFRLLKSRAKSRFTELVQRRLRRSIINKS